MDIAIVHYHLRVGGVTRVIRLAREGLEARGHRVLLVCGEPSAVEDAAVVPALAYGAPAREGWRVVEGVESACIRRFGRPADVLVVHNHSLGKNGSLPAAVVDWAGSGRALVLQIHDFAENGRPENYRRLVAELEGSGKLYPWNGRVRLAVLTSRAARRLEAAGTPASVLPNPACAPAVREPVPPGRWGAERLVVYPTRGIRRKNLGEFVLHARRAGKGDVFVVTGRPVARPDAAAYEAWVEWAAARSLPIVWDVCGRLQLGLGDVLAGAGLAVTTSIEEGFGMAFVEPFAAGIPLAGRDLPEATADFHARGLPLDRLYCSVPVPAGSFDAAAFHRRLERRVARALASYGRVASPAHFAAAREAVGTARAADFGRLDEQAQREVLESRCELEVPALEGMPEGEIARAAEILARDYSVEGAAVRLEKLCEEAAGARKEGLNFGNAQAVLDGFLDFQDFSALRYEAPDLM